MPTLLKRSNAPIDRSYIPEITPFPPFHLPQPEDRMLLNNIPLKVLSRGDQDVNCLTVTYPRGAVDLAGSSLFKVLQSTILEGTKNFSAEDISNLIDYNGAWLKFEIGAHFTDVKLYSLNSNFSNLLPLISDIINNPLFPADTVKRQIERDAAAAEINSKKVSTVADKELRRLIFGSHSRLLNCDTDPETLRTMQPADIIDSYHTIFNQSAPFLSIAGLVTDSMIDSLDSGLCLNSYSLPHLSPDNYDSFTPTTGCFSYHMPGAQQAAIAIGIPTIPRSHPDYCKLRIAVMALGGYFGSRLMKTVREELGLTYGISATLYGQPEGSYIGIKCQTSHDNVDRVIEEVNRQIHLLVTQPPTDDEITNLKATAMSGLVAVLDSPLSILDYTNNLIRLQAPADYFNEQQQSIERITAEDISRLTRDYILDISAATVIIDDDLNR